MAVEDDRHSGHRPNILRNNSLKQSSLLTRCSDRAHTTEKPWSILTNKEKLVELLSNLEEGWSLGNSYMTGSKQSRGDIRCGQ